MSDNPKGFAPEYDDNKKSNVMYFGKATPNGKGDDSTFRKVELLVDEDESYLSKKNSESYSTPVEFQIKDIITLCRSRGGQQKIQCWLTETIEDKSFQTIHISRRKGKGVYGSEEVTLTTESALALQTFLNNLTLMDTKERTQIPIISQNTGEKQAQQIISEHEFAELIKANIKSTDDFYKLLSIKKVELAVERLE